VIRQRVFLSRGCLHRTFVSRYCRVHKRFLRYKSTLIRLIFLRKRAQANLTRRNFLTGAAFVLSAPTLMSLSACGSKPVYWDGQTFKHGFDLDYRPYSYVDDNGGNAGFDVELAQAVCAYYGWEYVPVPFNWDAKDAELNAGSCDCIWSGFTINGREDDYLWSQAYSDNTQMIMVKKDSGIATLADLAGKKVGVQTATSAWELLNDEEGQKALADTFESLEVYETYTVAINDLKADAISAVAVDVTRANEAIANDDTLVLLTEALGSEQYGIGFRKSDGELCDQVNAALDALAADGTVAAIAANYPEIEEYIILGK